MHRQPPIKGTLGREPIFVLGMGYLISVLQNVWKVIRPATVRGIQYRFRGGRVGHLASAEPSPAIINPNICALLIALMTLRIIPVYSVEIDFLL